MVGILFQHQRTQDGLFHLGGLWRNLAIIGVQLFDGIGWLALASVIVLLFGHNVLKVR